MRIGDIAEDFTLPDEQGNSRQLTGFLANGPVVLFFYPAAMTRGCTAESCHFRDLGAEFAAVGTQRVGISPDPVAKQHEFASKYSFDFPLLADTDGTVAEAFGVRRKLGPLLTRRQTFVIGTDRRVLDVIKSELRMSVHANRALAALRNPQ
ncbi:peroxiredoxin Q/BCP [Tamaricihabitans halophyticus]|uniref:thioredoxin-dependent peroxiredoxin n=1 Tax=Tamaricihabitans halophyticus TaxID=1262583 RepID=A0A4R2QWK2_9PSEU|nr:peroxiredoxin [Tamaricihabitans halophyticus]TCP53654.1 peroxiredoxin Q/BCP [Tamaricihabitans halophyticus]